MICDVVGCRSKPVHQIGPNRFVCEEHSKDYKHLIEVYSDFQSLRTVHKPTMIPRDKPELET